MKLSAICSLTASLVAFALPFLAVASAGDAVRLHIDVDRPVLSADQLEKAIVKIRLEGLRLAHPESRPPVNLALVIDRSGSMSGDKIEKAREAALEAVNRLGPEDMASLIVYDDKVQTLVPASRVGSGSALRAAIRGIRPGGNTNLFGGVSQGASEVRKHTENRHYVHRVVLLSDGLANVGPSTPEELGRLGTSLVKEGISVTTIGLGLGFNEDLMTRLAKRSDGNTYFVESSRDLTDIFNRELGDVLNVVARSVVVEIEFPTGFRPLGFVGREGTIRGQKAEFTLNQIYGGQDRFALVEVEVVSNRATTEREIARATATFEDLVQRRGGKASASRMVRFSKDTAEVIRSANHQVQTEYAQNVIAMTKDRAVELVDAQRQDEAGKVLREQAQDLETLARTYSNSAVLEVATANAAAADRLEKDGLDNHARKSYRAESVQTSSQQTTSSKKR